MDDLISRQAAIDAIADYLSKTTYTSAISFLNTAALILARVPTAEPKRGKWIEQYGDMACPFCGFSCDDPYYLGDANYCPDCGAKLEWEE